MEVLLLFFYIIAGVGVTFGIFVLILTNRSFSVKEPTNTIEASEEELMAQLVARIISGVPDAEPKEEDYLLADQLIDIIEQSITKDLK